MLFRNLPSFSKVKIVGFWLFLSFLITCVLFIIFYRSEARYSAQIISFLSMFIASMVATAGLYFANQILVRYQWKRDQALADIKKIYEPCYEEIFSIISLMRNYKNYFRFPEIGWRELRKNQFAKIVELKNKKLFAKLESFYTRLEKEYGKHIDKGYGIIKKIFTEEITSRVKEKNLTEQQKEQLINKLLSVFNTTHGVFRELFINSSIREVSKAIFGIKSDENTIINNVKNSLHFEKFLGGNLEQYFQFSPEEIYKNVQNEIESNVDIKLAKRKIEELIQEATGIKELLEKIIVEPQLV